MTAILFYQFVINKESSITTLPQIENNTINTSTTEQIPEKSLTEKSIKIVNNSEIKTVNETITKNDSEGGAGAGPASAPTAPSTPANPTTTPSNETTEIVPEIDVSSYQYAAELLDVTDGEQIYTINTGGLASGIAYSKYDGEYELYIELYDLPQTTGDDEYAVWIAKIDGVFTVKKIGSPEYVNDKHILTYTSTTNLIDHNFIVITIEADGNSINPGDHILNGEFLLI